jgi:hypothetical protein
MDPRIRRNNANSNKNTVPSMIATSATIASLLTLSDFDNESIPISNGDWRIRRLENNDLDSTNDFHPRQQCQHHPHNRV